MMKLFQQHCGISACKELVRALKIIECATSVITKVLTQGLVGLLSLGPVFASPRELKCFNGHIWGQNKPFIISETKV